MEFGDFGMMVCGNFEVFKNCVVGKVANSMNTSTLKVEAWLRNRICIPNDINIWKCLIVEVKVYYLMAFSCLFWLFQSQRYFAL